MYGFSQECVSAHIRIILQLLLWWLLLRLLQQSLVLNTWYQTILLVIIWLISKQICAIEFLLDISHVSVTAYHLICNFYLRVKHFTVLLLLAFFLTHFVHLALVQVDSVFFLYLLLNSLIMSLKRFLLLFLLHLIFEGLTCMH